MAPRHIIQLAFLSSLWGLVYALTRVAVPLLGPNLSIFIRVTMAAVTLLVLMRLRRERWPHGHTRELLLLAFITVVFPHMLYAWASLHLPAGYAALLGVNTVLFGSIASAAVGLERMTRARIAGCLLGLAGAGLVVRLGPVQMTPMLLLAALACLAGAAFSGGSAPFQKRALQRMDPLAITAGMHAIAVPFLLPGALLDWPAARLEWHALAAVIGMGVVTSGLAWWAYMLIMRHVTAVAALSSQFMIMAFGVMWGVVLLGEKVGPAMWGGAALLVGAVLLVAGYNPLRRDKPLKT